MRRTPAHRKHGARRHGSGVTPPPEFGDVLREVFSLAVVRSYRIGGGVPVAHPPLASRPVPASERVGPASAGARAPLASDGSAYLRQVLGALDERAEQSVEATSASPAVSTSVT
jgi:hypothetical protein